MRHVFRLLEDAIQRRQPVEWVVFENVEAVLDTPKACYMCLSLPLTCLTPLCSHRCFGEFRVLGSFCGAWRTSMLMLCNACGTPHSVIYLC